jgi:hypothetical protein
MGMVEIDHPGLHLFIRSFTPQLTRLQYFHRNQLKLKDEPRGDEPDSRKSSIVRDGTRGSGVAPIGPRQHGSMKSGR